MNNGGGVDARQRAAAFKCAGRSDALTPDRSSPVGKGGRGGLRRGIGFFKRGCYNVTRSLLSLATVSPREACETEASVTAEILKRTRRRSFRGACGALRATVVSCSEDNY